MMFECSMAKMVVINNPHDLNNLSSNNHVKFRVPKFVQLQRRCVNIQPCGKKEWYFNYLLIPRNLLEFFWKSFKIFAFRFILEFLFFFSFFLPGFLFRLFPFNFFAIANIFLSSGSYFSPVLSRFWFFYGMSLVFRSSLLGLLKTSSPVCSVWLVVVLPVVGWCIGQTCSDPRPKHLSVVSSVR